MLHEDSTKEPRSNSYLNYPTKVYITLNESRNKERHTIFPNSQGGKKTLAGVANYNVELGQWINWAIREGIIDEKIANPCECDEVEIPDVLFKNCGNVLSCINTNLDISTPGSGAININFTKPDGTISNVLLNVCDLLSQTSCNLFTILAGSPKQINRGGVLTINPDNSLSASFTGDLLNLSAKLDPDPTNTLEVRANGLYVAPGVGSGTETDTFFEPHVIIEGDVDNKYVFKYTAENGDVYYMGYDLQCGSNVFTISRIWRKDATASGGADTGFIEQEVKTCSIGGSASGFSAYETTGSSATLIHTSTANNVTYSRIGNTGTISIPNGTDMRHFVLNETALNIGGTTSFILEIEDLGSGVNDATVASMKIPVLQFYSRDNLSNDPPTSTFPYNGTMDNPPTPIIQVVGYSNEKVIMRINNVDSYSEWTIIGNW